MIMNKNIVKGREFLSIYRVGLWFLCTALSLTAIYL